MNVLRSASDLCGVVPGMCFPSRRRATCLWAVLLLSGGALADTLTFQQGVGSYASAYDTYIDAALGSQATTTPIVIDGDPVEQVLIRFDDIFGSGANQIPAGSTIVSATLTLRVGSGANDPSNSPVNFHRLLHPWVDTGIWADYGVPPWNTQGGIQADDQDALIASDATATMSAASTAYPVNVTASVQAWSSSPSSNYGWAILPTGTDGLRLESSESTTPSYRPLLTVVFNPPCGGPEDCADGDLCTTDECVAGACVNTPITCPPGQSCDPATGQCESAPQTVTFQQGVSGYTGTVDTYLHLRNPNTNNASATTLVVDGPGADPNDTRQILLRFGGIFASEGGPIPDGVQITSATLTINVTDASDDGAELHRMIMAWSDSDTWNSTVDGVQLDGTEARAAADTSSLYNSTGLHTFDVTPSLAAWAAGEANRGWVWVTPAGGNNSWQFNSAEGTAPPLLTVTYTAAPPQITLVAPEDGATEVPAAPTLQVTVTDPQSDPLDVTFYGRESGGAVSEDFMIIHITDTQFCSESAPEVYRAQMSWVNAQRAANNIVHLIHTGDITNVDVDYQWVNADSAMDLLEAPLPGLPYGVPYGVLPGNHDSAPGSTLLYNQYFGVNRFLGRPYYGGHYGSTNDNNFTLFSGGGMDFIAVQLAMQPSSVILDWADGVLKAHSNRRAIVSSHYIMEVGENAPFSSWGQAIYNALKDNPNLFLMLCGHMHGEGKRYDEYEGRRVWTLIADYQTVESGHSGYMRLLRFSPADNKIYVQTYSPTANGGAGGYMTGPTSQFELDYAMDGSGPFTLLGTVPQVASGSTASLPWPGRMAGKTYEWHVTASDGSTTVTSPTWLFTSNGVCATTADCDDGVFCNGDETCPGSGGVCVAGTSPCPPEQLCDEDTQTCVACISDSDCNDNDLCTTDTCVAGACVREPIDCKHLDGDCTVGACNPYTGQCEALPANEGDPCDDGLTCTDDDVCVDGACVGTDMCPNGKVCDPGGGGCVVPSPLLTFQDGVENYSGTVDTFLRQAAAGTSYGAAEWVEWDQSEGGSNNETMTLIRFENLFGDGYGKIPVGSSIVSATLTYVVRDVGNPGDVREALVDWAESVTYNTFGSLPGAQPNEYSTTSVATAPGEMGTQSINVTSSLQLWANDPGLNRGWLIRWTGSSGVEAWSSEAPVISNRPKLTVLYQSTCQDDLDCDDSNPCTADHCVSGDCEFTPLTGDSCDDGDPCTLNDACTNGECTGAPKVCDPGYACNPASGNCEPELASDPLPVAVGDQWRYFKGTTAPPANWNTLAFDDSGWLSGASGFGYGPDCTAERGTILSDMSGNYVSVYMRRLFHVEDPDLISRLVLTVDFDDAFVAYINGTEVARQNIVGTPPSYTQLATVNHECSVCNTTCNAAMSFELTEYVDLLTDNTNILAVQGHNLTATSSDFTLLVTLTATMAPACQGDPECNDGNACTTDACVSGNCEHTPVVCDDGVACTDDACDPQFGCQYTDNCPLGEACDPGTGACVPLTLMSCVLADTIVNPGQSVDLTLFVENAPNVRGYQTQIAIQRTSGSGALTVECPDGVVVDETRADYIFHGYSPTYPATNCAERLASSSLYAGGVTVGPTPAYLAGYTLTLSPDAAPGSTFEVTILPPPGSVLYDATAGNPQPISFNTGPACVVTVGAPNGACCYPDGSCAITTQADCAGGQWLGADTTCDQCPPTNDNCLQQTPVGEGTFPFDTTNATFDGPGYCMGSPSQNIWYCYTPTASGTATVTVSAAWSTMLAVYHDCTCPPTSSAMMMCCHPTTCTIIVQQGHGYLIEVGGVGAAAGAGTLTISLSGGACYIDGQWYDQGDLNPANECEWCDSANPNQWSPRPDGTACDDGEWCTVNDQCTDGACGGTPRDCSDPLSCTIDTCNEATDACDHAQAPDTCLIDGVCYAAGALNPTNSCQVCDPSINPTTWTNMANGTPCSDGLYCTATDVCQDGSCVGGSSPCAPVCEECREGSDVCEHCMFDLEPSSAGVIGGGDFGIFAGDYGSCYPPGDPRRRSNFDNDPNGCVGGGDFGVFSGCYARTCADCATCYGGGRGDSRDDAFALVRLVAVRAPAPSDIVAELPESLTTFTPGETFYLELWATGSRGSDGLAAVYADVTYDPRRLVIDGLSHGVLFSLFSYGTPDDAVGVVAGLGGCAPLGEGSLGTEGAWVRVATLTVHGRSFGRIVVQPAPAAEPRGVAIFNRFGDLDASQIEFDGVDLGPGKLVPAEALQQVIEL